MDSIANYDRLLPLSLANTVGWGFGVYFRIAFSYPFFAFFLKFFPVRSCFLLLINFFRCFITQNPCPDMESVSSSMSFSILICSTYIYVQLDYVTSTTRPLPPTTNTNTSTNIIQADTSSLFISLSFFCPNDYLYLSILCHNFFFRPIFIIIKNIQRKTSEIS